MSDDMYHRMAEMYGAADRPPEVAELVDIHSGITSFLSLLEQAGGVPEDLDADGKRRLSTAETNLRRALRDIEAEAEQRLDE